MNPTPIVDAEPNKASASTSGGLLVVVPAKDAEETLPACLAAIAASVFRPDAVVLVDDGSSDGTAAIAQTAGVLVLRPEGAPVGPGRARDLAVSRTAAGFGGNGARSADLVALVDADVVVHPEALGRLVAELREDPGVVAAFGSYDDDPPAPAIPSRYANLRHHFVHQNAGGEAVTFWAGLGVVRREAWDAVGGFGDRYDRPAIEDIDLGRRLVHAGGRIRCVPAAQATHHKAWTLRQLWRTDVFQRALPWSRLLVNEPAVTPVEPLAHGRSERVSKLNAGRADQLSALAVHGFWFTLLLGLLVHPLLLLGPVACLAAWVLLNRRFLGLLFRRGGARLLLGGGLLHATYHGYASLVFAWVLIESRWRRDEREPGDSRWIALALTTLLLLAAGAAAGGLLAVAAVPTDTLAGLLRRVVGGDGGPLAGLAAGADALRIRAALLGLVYAAVGAGLALAGPRPIRRVLDGLPRLTHRTLRPLIVTRWTAGCVAVLTGLLALRIGLHLDQPMRADEAQTFLRSGAGNPLYPLFVWTSPNNHVLHSFCMRLSVGLFGTAPGAVRLPAALMTAACTPLVFLALRRWIGVAAALLACALWAGSAYAVETGTNARGYPFVLAATLVLATLLPRVRSGRPAAVVAAAAAAAVGAWAVPVMVLPLAAFLGCVLLPLARWRRNARVAAAVAGLAGLFTLTLYLPALLLVRAQSTGAASAVRDAVAPLTLPERVRVLGYNLGIAWEQMSFPALGAGSTALGVLLLTGVALALGSGRRRRRLLVGSSLGLGAVMLALAVPPMPWWSLGFAFPFLIGLLVLPVACLLRRLDPAAASAAGWPLVAVAAGVFALQATLVAASGYPQRFPDRIGYPDGPAAAGVVAALLDGSEPGASTLRVYAGPERRSVLLYHLEQARPAVPAGTLDETIRPPLAGERLLLVEPFEGTAAERETLLRGLAPTPAERWRLPASELLLFEQ